MIVNKYKDTVFYLSDAGQKLYLIFDGSEEWLKVGPLLESDVEGVEDVKLTPICGNFVNMSETAEKRRYGWDAWT